MESTLETTTAAAVRVQLAGGITGSSLALAGWIREHGCRCVVGPLATTAGALALAAVFRPDVVLLDFHALTASIDSVVSQFKQLLPAVSVVVLTHEVSDAMRRRCQTARVDDVFEKTRELDQLAALFGRLHFSALKSGAQPSPSPAHSLP